MWKQDGQHAPATRPPRPESGDTAGSRAPAGSNDIASIGQVIPPWALQAVVAAYGGNASRLLTDLADLVETSVAYVDRPTVRPIWNDRCPTTIGRPSPRTGARRPFGAARLTHLLAECRP